MLRDFIWNNFELTGNIQSYLAYKELEQRNEILVEPKVEVQEAAVSNM